MSILACRCDRCYVPSKDAHKQLALTSLALFRQGFFRPSGTGGRASDPPPPLPNVALKPRMLWPPNLNRIVYAIILITTDTVMSL